MKNIPIFIAGNNKITDQAIIALLSVKYLNPFTELFLCVYKNK